MALTQMIPDSGFGKYFTSFRCNCTIILLFFHSRPYQQVFSSVTGALTTSLLMTPMDVVKTRLQTQQKLMLSHKCYLYCNGLMDHICACGPNGSLVPDKLRFNGTIVSGPGMSDLFDTHLRFF